MITNSNQSDLIISIDDKADIYDPAKVICDYLDSQRVLTLCCHYRDMLWCANCFYLFEAELMSFLIMTDSNTRHGQIIEKNANVVGTISSSSQEMDITTLKGIQFSGSISLLIGDKEHPARLNYYNCFPIARLIPSPIWRLKLHEIKMTDNSKGFANKYHWRCR